VNSVFFPVQPRRDPCRIVEAGEHCRAGQSAQCRGHPANAVASRD
jgi:hypothetical protein